jgi:hypothetical protein
MKRGKLDDVERIQSRKSPVPSRPTVTRLTRTLSFCAVTEPICERNSIAGEVDEDPVP